MPSDVPEISEAKEREEDHSTGYRLGRLLRKSFLSFALLRWVFWPPSSTGSSSSSPARLRPTAYLDGLRGFAALIVYWHHHELWPRTKAQTDIIENAFGSHGQYYFAAFPGIRTLFGGGHWAVATFFVISGYALSVKPLSLIHAGDPTKVAENLSSALFRRWLRLFIPLICTTFVYLTSWHLLGIWVNGANPRATYLSEVWAWYAELKNFSFVFHLGGDPWFTYNFHLWSIPVEFRGSIIVYTSLLALSRCSRNARLWLEAGLVFYFLYIVDGAHFAMFTAGMLLCDLELLAAKDDLPAWFGIVQQFKRLIVYHALAISLYLGGVPVIGSDIKPLRDSPGWYLLSFLKPQAVFEAKSFYLFWAAVFFVASVPHLPWLRRFFETRVCQFLGRISYALYLVHGPILSTLGDRLYALVGWESESRREHLAGWLNGFPLPKGGPMGLELAFLLPHVVLLPLTLYCAEVVTRVVDEPSVRFPNWLYRKSLGQPAAGRLPA